MASTRVLFAYYNYIIIIFLLHYFYFALKSVDTSNYSIEKLSNTSKKILPGNHFNIPNFTSRIGPDGEVGYVHDPQFLTTNPREYEITNNVLCLPPGEWDELPEGYAALMKIRNYMETSKENRDVKLFCAIYTYNGGVKNTNAIQETWGKKCDGLLFASSESNKTTGHMHLPSNSNKGFGYRGMVQRTRTILSYLYDYFLDDYDFFHISGDDVYLIIENLKEFLASKKVKDWDNENYLIAGFWLHWGQMKEGYIYMGGGSGYTLSRKALKAYVEGPLQTCDVWKDGSAEDVIFSDCAKKLNSDKFIDTRDSVGAHRYHQLPVQRHATFPHTKWGFSTNMIKQALEHLERNFNFPIVYQDAYISSSSIAFHKHSNVEIRRYEMLLYKNVTQECT